MLWHEKRAVQIKRAVLSSWSGDVWFNVKSKCVCWCVCVLVLTASKRWLQRCECGSDAVAHSRCLPSKLDAVCSSVLCLDSVVTLFCRAWHVLNEKHKGQFQTFRHLAERSIQSIFFTVGRAVEFVWGAVRKPVWRHRFVSASLFLLPEHGGSPDVPDRRVRRPLPFPVHLHPRLHRICLQADAAPLRSADVGLSGHHGLPVHVLRRQAQSLGPGMEHPAQFQFIYVAPKHNKRSLEALPKSCFGSIAQLILVVRQCIKLG